MSTIRNGTAEQFQRAAQRLEREGKIARNVLAAPGREFKLGPDDILVARTLEIRSAEQALVVARKRPGGARATYKGATARMFVFARGA